MPSNLYSSCTKSLTLSTRFQYQNQIHPNAFTHTVKPLFIMYEISNTLHPIPVPEPDPSSLPESSQLFISNLLHRKAAILLVPVIIKLESNSHRPPAKAKTNIVT